MQLRDAAYWLKLDPRKAKESLARIRNCMTSSITMTDDIPMDEVQALWKSFPDHARVLMISVIPKEEGAGDHADVNMLGAWDGRQMRVAERLFKRAYKQYRYSLSHGSESATFRSQPTVEEIKILDKKDRQRVAQMEAEQVEKAGGADAPVVRSPLVEKPPRDIWTEHSPEDEKPEEEPQVEQDEEDENIAQEQEKPTVGLDAIQFDAAETGVSTISEAELEAQGLS